MYRAFFLLLVSIFIFTAPATAKEQKKGGGPPPMLVTTSKITVGSAEPMANFVGTIFYGRTAQVAAEVDGIVEKVFIEDGQDVKSGAPLARLDDDLLATELSGTRALYEQSMVDATQAKKDFNRIASLYDQEAIATSEYEAYKTRFNRLQKQTTVLKSRLDRQMLEQKKKTVRAPFDGIIIESLVEAGEWVKSGGTVAVIADNRRYEAHVDISSNIIPYLSRGETVDITVAGEKTKGTFIAVIPRGDISTRTFIAKFLLDDTGTLIEGMEAQAALPINAANESLLVPRDAVVNNRGSDVVFTNNGGTAKMFAVEIIGYAGDNAGIRSSDLESGQEVVVKGSERIRDGQPIRTE